LILGFPGNFCRGKPILLCERAEENNYASLPLSAPVLTRRRDRWNRQDNVAGGGLMQAANAAPLVRPRARRHQQTDAGPDAELQMSSRAFADQVS
jgi:hypothetical protein